MDTSTTACARSCKPCSFSMLLGRLCLSTIFILSGLNKFMDPNPTGLYMLSKGMSFIPFFLYTAAIIEVLCGVGIALGLKTRWSATLLLLYLIPVTFIFHSFWNVPPAEQMINMIDFLKNLAIFGGLLYIVGTGPGKISVDHLLQKE